MNNVIVGTAGHVDHGKTCLIEALSGTNTDRLKEEKNRGITIDLGFAEISNDSDIQIGVIDVPGHEKFIKNMLAGIGGIDYVLFVVAADEGVMPQSIEHLRILDSLGIKTGIIVLTKMDLVDEEWVELVKEDIRDLTKDTFLHDAQIIETSTKTGENLETLKDAMFELAVESNKRRTSPELTRLSIDRVFTVDGFGTVITGTLDEGLLKPGDTVNVYPQDKPIKVRSVQVHGKSVDEASAGQRTALNLTNVKKEELSRGNILATPDSLKPSTMLDVKLSVFTDSERDILNNSRVHFYCGSTEALAKVVILDRDVLTAGEEAYVQLRFEEYVTFKKGDAFILRFYSPVETIAGGYILDANPAKHKRFKDEVLNALKLRDTSSGEQAVDVLLSGNNKKAMTAKEISFDLNMELNEVTQYTESLVTEGKVLKIENMFISKKTFEILVQSVEDILKDYYKNNPITSGVPIEELRTKINLANHYDDLKYSASLLKYLVDNGYFTESKGLINSKNRVVEYTEDQKKVMNSIEKEYEDFGYEVEELDSINNTSGIDTKQIVEFLASDGKLVKLKYPYFIHINHWNKALDIIKKHFDSHDKITLGEFRDELDTSRKFAMMILDAMDDMKITEKNDDYRVLL